MPVRGFNNRLTDRVKTEFSNGFNYYELSIWSECVLSEKNDNISIESADYWIERLQLKPHPEGGYYKETYRSSESIGQQALPARYDGQREFSTAIYFLLKGDQFSRLHRLKTDEIWHFYFGSSLKLHIIDGAGQYTKIKLGPEIDEGQVFQAVIKANNWFGAAVDNSDMFSLVGCTMSPGFDFSDFELGDRLKLISLYPEHRAIIAELCP